MHKYVPEGSADSSFATQAGGGVGGESFEQLKQKVLETPGDLDARLALLEYLLRRRAASARKHLLWLIDNHPRHCAHQFIVLHKVSTTYSEGRQHWLRQLDSCFDDVAVVFHAAVFFSILSLKDSLRLFERAAELDPTNEEFPRRLSHLYANMAGSGSTAENEFFAHMAAQQMMIAVERYMVPSTLDSYLLPYFSSELSQIAELVMQFHLLEDARNLGELLMKHRSINEGRLNEARSSKSRSNKTGISDGIYALSECLGHSILGRVELAYGQIEAAKEQLVFMMQLPVGRRSDWSLANALLQIGETQIVCEYIEWFGRRLRANTTENSSGMLSAEDVSFITQKQNLLINWLNEIRAGRIPTLS